MKRKNTLILGIAAIVAGLVMTTSCGRGSNFIGSWTATTPTSIAPELPAASTATSLVSIDFLSGSEPGKGGGVFFSSIIEATQPINTDTTGMQLDDPYEVSVSATASVGGTWSYKGDDRDEVVIAFDMNTLKIDVDPAGVAFSQNLLTGAQQPTVDSLTTRTAENWKRQIKSAVISSLNRYSEIDDIKVNKDRTTLTFEVKDVTGRDQTVIMRRVINSD